MQIYSFMIVKIKTRESDLIPIYLRFALASLTCTTNIKEEIKKTNQATILLPFGL